MSDSAALNQTSKDVSLEALRGIAAVIVIFWHSVLAFWPDDRLGIADTIFNFLIFGPAAVSFFFVLSGFVLTRTFFLTANWSILTRGALKRWPRLAGPVLLTVLASWALMNIGAYGHSHVAEITHSDWLRTFGNAYQDGEPPSFSLKSALTQGLFTVFFRGDHGFDSSLWTMRFELFGSLVAFGLAALVQKTRSSRTSCCYLLLLTIVGAHLVSPSYVAFPVGVGLALLLPPKPRLISPLVATPGLIFSAFLLGYSEGAEGVYSPLTRALPAAVPETYLHIIASALIIGITETSPAVRRRLSGPSFRVLGEFSFPVYLTHVLMLASIGCAVFTLAEPGWARVAATAATLVFSFLSAYPLVLFNRAWVRAVNKAAAHFMA